MLFEKAVTKAFAIPAPETESVTLPLIPPECLRLKLMFAVRDPMVTGTPPIT